MANATDTGSKSSKASRPPGQSSSITADPRNDSSISLHTIPAVRSRDDPAAITPHETSSAIGKTISELENLLQEAVQIVRQAAEKEEKQNEIPRHAPNAQRRPSRRTQSRTSAFTEQSGKEQKYLASRRKTQPHVSFSASLEDCSRSRGQQSRHAEDALLACRPAQKELSKLKAGIAPPTLITDNEEWELKPILKHRRNMRTSSEKLGPVEPKLGRRAQETVEGHSSRRSVGNGGLPSTKEIKKYIKAHHAPPIAPRGTSKNPALLRHGFAAKPGAADPSQRSPKIKHEDSLTDKEDGNPGDLYSHEVDHRGHFSKIFGVASKQTSIDLGHVTQPVSRKVNLRGCRHVDIHGSMDDIDLHESCQHQSVARDWPNSRKRFAATIACVNTACIGIIIGIYAGEVPAIQYVIVDMNHYTILGNVFLYIGLVFPTLFLWPLPLLHGRKPYTLAAFCVALCLQVPQGVAVGAFRSPYVRTYRVVLLLSRAVSGFALGFANINLHSTLLDVFGASLQSHNPHQEVLDENDARRHGGGMGVWLAIWSWCSIGPISLGFLFGALIISATNVTWGFWLCLLLLMFVLLLNMIAPEPRRSAFRRTLAEMSGNEGFFSRIGRGEVKMHLKEAGPLWWGEEVKAGVEMCWLMLKQPGFVMVAIYAAWVYAQFTMILMLLGSLASRSYNLLPQYVGLCGVSLGVGALLAMPFQKASVFSRARHHPPRTDSMTFQRSHVWSSHLTRRTVFTVLLPLTALAYTLTSRGPPMPVAVPCVCAAVVGYLSNLAMAECYGLIMTTFDTSDLQPGMTGRPFRKSVIEILKGGRTNFSCHPRVSAGFAITQTLQFIFGAVATGACGRLERQLGTFKATAIVAGSLLGLTILLTAVLRRSIAVEMIPVLNNPGDNLTRRKTMWEPVIIGQPSGTRRKISILEAGRQSRWSEIRKRNRLDNG